MELLSIFPQPLLDDLVEGRWLPIVGAGFSRNAVVPAGKQMPLWDDLGRGFARDLADYPYSTPLDAMSAFEHEFSRARLVERLSDLLLVNDAQPGSAHNAFCALSFDIVCTTNLDFLLERQYIQTGRYCRPVIDEYQLAINQPTPTTLLKVHGDVHHPDRLVVTEADYDNFLTSYPLFATFLSSLLITRTAVLIGYSLDDPDFRQLWQVIGDRLGSTRRDAYVLLLAPRRSEIARYERRGVKVLQIPSNGRSYEERLTDIFCDLSRYLEEHAVTPGDIMDERVRDELTFPADAPNRVCFFSIPHDLQWFYQEYVFPIAENYGVVPMTAEDLIREGENVAAKIEALISRSHAVVVDVGNRFTMQELAVAQTHGKSSHTLAVLSTGTRGMARANNIKYIQRPDDVHGDLTSFLAELRDWFSTLEVFTEITVEREPARLLEMGEFRAAVISSMTLLETTIRRIMLNKDAVPSERMSLGGLLRTKLMSELVDEEYLRDLDKWRRVRNRAVHTTDAVDEGVARDMVHGVVEFVAKLREMS